jgi:hypothetical protein
VRPLPGFDASGKPVVTPGEDTDAEKAAEEAAKKRQAKLDLAAKMAQQYLENAKKEFGEDSPLVLPFVQRADAAAKAAVRDQADQVYAYEHGLIGNRPAYDKAREQSAKEKQEETARQRIEAQKQRADSLAYISDNTAEKYGPFSVIAAQRAKEAQQAAEIVARNEGDFVGLQKLYDSATGPLKELKDRQKEVWEKSAESIKNTLSTLDDSQQILIAEIVGSGESRLRGIQRGARPNNVFGDVQADERGQLTNTITTIEQVIERIRKYSDGSSATNKELETMKERLADANAALVDFNDRLQAQAYQRRIKSEEDAYQLRSEDITHLHRLRFSKDDEGAYQNKVQELGELLQNAQQHLENVAKLNSGVADASDKVREAAKGRDLAAQNLTDYQIDAKVQRYLNVYQNVKGATHDLLSGFLHGQGDLGTVAQGVGETIVQASFDQFIKKYTDPLVSTITGEILALQGNTDALTLNTATITGGGIGGLGGSPSSSPLVSAVASGVQQGIDGVLAGGAAGAADGAGGGKSAKGRAGLSDLQKGVSAGLAAYSIGATSAAQGVNAGNFLGGVLSGASIGASFGPGGGLIGGLVGGAVDLIGGLFHHNKKPTDTPQNLNPALYNAPSGFDLAAYNYSAYGKLPTLQNVGFEVKPITPPTFNIYVDGAKVAAQIEINRQATSVNVTLGNTVRDRYAPV